ncbi:serine/threonine protein kinase [Streptomyces sp. NBC_01803]|uniref:serine/threonine protein kinase n=1 Tax=Streptomyces sp. NBC_01803 TaxID=2975946 RepID=UPI002DDA0219|nr:protein kinase [Streptomyces sp. NBC_01803]WSA45066.1 protein kinase [Streptomyces sp. NBC_01803]
MDRLMPNDPHRIGQYRLLARLGEGGMGQVFLARSERGRTVAVKTIRSELAQERDFRRRFALEITAARQVGGRWTAPVLDADTEAATPWVATGYIAGPSLHEVVGRDFGPLPERSVRLLANGLAHALSDIHGAGLVHRDLKPSNVLVTIDGPRVIDFGIARALEQTGEALTRTGATVGSPGFMSPEQVRGQRLTPASDVFCLGSLLAYTATGRTPFGTLDSGVHILMFRIAEETPDLTDIPEGLRQLIADCLAKEPERRPSVEELLSATTHDGSREPWLPGELIAQLGRHAVELLDSENPESRTDTPAVKAPPPQATATQLPPTASTPLPRPAPSPPGPASWPSPHATRQPRPTPVPSPYSQPNGSYQPPAPSMPNSLGGYGPSPYPSGPLPPQRRSRRAPAVLGAVALLVVMAVLGVIVAQQLSGGSDDPTIDEAYLGAWQGEYTNENDEVKELRFEIHQGDEGDVIGTALTLTETTLCAYRMVLGSFGGELAFTEQADWAVPEEQADESCRDNDTVQTLRLSEDGEEMEWRYSSQSTTLASAERSDATDVPETLVGQWRDEGTNDDDEEIEDLITISQGSIGDSVLRYERSVDGEPTCVWENRLVKVEGREITLGPDVVVENPGDEPCRAYASFRLWSEEGDDDTIRLLWLDDLEADPAEVDRND